MSNIKALEELKDALESCRFKDGIKIPFDSYWITADACDALLKKMEAEIAERFMELPVGADGIPIRVGDYLQLGDTRGEVVALTYCPNGKLPWEWQCDTGDWHKTAFARHAKPRTLEDVLRDVWKEALDYAKSDMWRNPDEVFAERADEIRVMFGEVDA